MSVSPWLGCIIILKHLSCYQEGYSPRTYEKNVLLTISRIAPRHVQNSQSLSLRKSKWFNHADGHLPLLHDWFWVNTLPDSFVYTIHTHTVYTHIPLLAAVVVHAICQD